MCRPEAQSGRTHHSGHPGRLLEHLTACNLSLSGVETLVLDEADRILDMGFSADVQQILQAVNKTRQNLLFSATFSEAVKSWPTSCWTNPRWWPSTSRTPLPTP